MSHWPLALLPLKPAPLFPNNSITLQVPTMSTSISTPSSPEIIVTKTVGRCTWREDDITLLLTLMKRRPVITTKETIPAGKSQQHKRDVTEAWAKLLKEFNVIVPEKERKTLNQLQTKYKNARQDATKRLSARRRDLLKTGGGSPEVPLKEDPEAELINDLSRGSLVPPANG